MSEKLFNVMIVDDEILAIQHLKAMVDWEPCGFRIAGESLRPKQALAAMAQLKPELVFVDIRMPGMDGLEFSRQAAAQDPKVRIILLTSYKEFEYAKEALRIGVRNYLVKHELDRESLMRELADVRRELLEEAGRRAGQLRQALKELIRSGGEGDEQLMIFEHAGYGNGRAYTYLLADADRPFPVLPGAAAAPQANPPYPFVESRELPGSFEHVASVKLEEGAAGLLFVSGPTASRRQQAEEQYRLAQAVKALYRVDGLGASSVVYTQPFNRLEELPALHRRAAKVMAGRVFGGGGLCMGLAVADADDSRRLEGSKGWNRLEWAGLDAGQLQEAADRAFELVQAAARPEQLAHLCSELSEYLDGKRAESGLPPLAVRSAEEGNGGAPASWFTLNGIRQWFASVIPESLKPPGPAYSRKIREAYDYMQAHLGEELTTEDIARYVGVSTDHLRHIFRDETGQTLLDALTDLRIDRAKRLLRSGQYKLYEVSQLVGYRSAHYFTRVFQKAAGLHPLEYAEQAGKPGACP